MSVSLFCVKVNFSDDAAFDLWKVVEISYELDISSNKIYYVDFVYESEDGVSKKVKYSEESNMIYGIEDYDLTIDDIDILIKFINLNTYKTPEFTKKFINSLYCTLTPDYIYKNILY